MKKQTVILFLLLGLSHTAFAQRVIENPAYEFKSTGINTITQIERNKENTRVQVHCEFIPTGGFLSTVLLTSKMRIPERNIFRPESKEPSSVKKHLCLIPATPHLS
ncbi:hypothetical protein C825_000048 [Parabacteroides sp. ASF519]|nr:hypothetical protein C825_000048 [Parabacteroides sp. ASF519]